MCKQSFFLSPPSSVVLTYLARLAKSYGENFGLGGTNKFNLTEMVIDTLYWKYMAKVDIWYLLYTLSKLSLAFWGKWSMNIGMKTKYKCKKLYTLPKLSTGYWKVKYENGLLLWVEMDNNQGNCKHRHNKWERERRKGFIRPLVRVSSGASQTYPDQNFKLI